MRGFMLFSLFTLAYSAPQNYGYSQEQNSNQQSHQPHLQYGAVPAGTMDFFHDLQTVMAVQGNNFALNSIDQYTSEEIPTTYSPQQQQQQPQARYLAPSILVASNNHLQTPYEVTKVPFTQPLQQHNSHSSMDAPIISKRFFLHSAPEDEDEEIQHRHITVGKPRKNFNVVFIKAPAKANKKTSLKIFPAANEDRTIVYVLAKKHDPTDIDAQVHEPVVPTTKPEVFFIKYKTQEEAEHAQHSIQSQYEALGGSTQISNEGIAPVSSVIGSLDATAGNEVYAEQSGAGQTQSLSEETYMNSQEQSEEPSRTNNGYLPPVKRY